MSYYTNYDWDTMVLHVQSITQILDSYWTTLHATLPFRYAILHKMPHSVSLPLLFLSGRCRAVTSSRTPSLTLQSSLLFLPPFPSHSTHSISNEDSVAPGMSPCSLGGSQATVLPSCQPYTLIVDYSEGVFYCLYCPHLSFSIIS